MVIPTGTEYQIQPLTGVALVFSVMIPMVMESQQLLNCSFVSILSLLTAMGME